MDLSTGLVGALNPTIGKTPSEKYLPLTVVLVWLTCTVLIMFGVTLAGNAGTVAYGTLSGAAGVFIKIQAPKPS